MKIAGTMYNDCINGPGWRVTVFCSGCDILCEGCQNKHWQNFNFGELKLHGVEISVGRVYQWIKEYIKE